MWHTSWLTLLNIARMESDRNALIEQHFPNHPTASMMKHANHYQSRGSRGRSVTINKAEVTATGDETTINTLADLPPLSANCISLLHKLSPTISKKAAGVCHLQDIC